MYYVKEVLEANVVLFKKCVICNYVKEVLEANVVLLKKCVSLLVAPNEQPMIHIIAVFC